MISWTKTGLIALAFLYVAPAFAGPYDALPLRGALSDLPHFQTSLGRDQHRFAGAEINRYRLYDFYARQARFHLTNSKFSPLLLPFPGLEGGRRGHWGGTNEKLSGTVFNRTAEPKYYRLTNRDARGDQYVSISHKNAQSLCLFSSSSPSMTKVVLNAQLRAPLHAFSHQVDRLGFGMSHTGSDYLVNKGSEWLDPNGKNLPITNDGYHLHQDKVIFRRYIGETLILDHPTVKWVDGLAVYSRTLESMGNTTPFVFLMPLEAKLLKQPTIKIHQQEGLWRVVVDGGDRILTHHIQSSNHGAKITVKVTGGRVRVSIPKMGKGDRISMSSWIVPIINKQTIHPQEKPSKLSSFILGGERLFTENITVKGTLNADPAASGTAYEIDDIPVPANNPYGTPMTTCGLAFSTDGTAYVSTLVGDIWKVTGLDQSLEKITWQRYASGLNSPLGLEVVSGVLHVLTQHQVLRLYDQNNDGEADLIRPLVKGGLPAGRLHDLQQDAQGNLYLSHASGVHRISKDGKTINKISGTCRSPFGLSVRSDGLALSDSSEGNIGNGTCSVFESQHAENNKSVSKNRRILYLPRGVDNSPGSRLFLNSQKFGPLGKSLLGLSYGTGRYYQILRDPNHGSPQAALQLLPGEFSNGTARLATNPRDGQVYVIGMDGWGDFATTEGSLSRIRYTGKTALVPTSWKSYRNGISVRFNQAIDQKSVSIKRTFIQQWNYIDSAHTYGSPEYSVKQPGKIGHDRLEVKKVYLSDDGKELFINVPQILPAMCTQIYTDLKSVTGEKLTLDLYATINKFSNKNIQGEPAPDGKPTHLVVPEKNNNGNTYANIIAHFDKLAGRDTVKRPVGPSVAYKKSQLNYQWINQNIIHKQACITCHAANAKHDFSTYESLMKSINTKHPEKSHLLGMIRAGSMPPFPMPTVAPEMQQALREWIEMGAPR